MNEQSTDDKSFKEENVQITQNCTEQQLMSQGEQLNEQVHADAIEDDFEMVENKAGTIEQIDKLQNVMDKALHIVGLYKNEIDDLKQKIGDMKEIVLKREEEDKQRIVPIVTQLSQIYKEEFGKLSDQNRILEEELQVAVADKKEVVDQIYSCVDKIKLLEQSIYKGEMPPYLKRRMEEDKKKREDALKSLNEQ